MTVTIILAEAAEVTDVLKENSTLIREWKPMSDNATDLVAVVMPRYPAVKVYVGDVSDVVNDESGTIFPSLIIIYQCEQLP